ncbi:hypothetical protein ACS8UU_004603, partial [Vibrio parahaemolyticus]
SFTTLVNIEIERRYDNLDFELLPLDLCDIAAFFFLQTNAQLRGEARNDQAVAWHFNTETTAY